MQSPQTIPIPPADNQIPTWKIKLLFDGLCPLCVREVNFLKRKDGDRGSIAFVDIAADEYNPADHGGVDFETAMGRIHAILPDGAIVPIVGVLADRLYGVWADYRLLLTGRSDLKTIVAERQQRKQKNKPLGRCVDGCEIVN
jgi:predicted DCC family thiol-disulfide oxidoreductase YuxK